uniref:Odorant receptor n=1 Tax=Trichogramma kaykai TaxID=54128 RepID=A0ABD2WMR1_9HYME
MLFGQIAVTLPNLCLSIYLLSTQNIASMDFVMTTQFFSAVVIELFFFCWYGNQVTLNSFDVEAAISTMDWTSLTARSQKFLLQMMVRTARPILFRVGPIMDMNIDSFLSIMKTSYSAFSVLQSTKE